VGLQYLFLEPNAEDPLHKGNKKVGHDWHKITTTELSSLVSTQFLSLFYLSDAAEDLRTNRKSFEYNVKQSMRGRDVKGNYYDNVMAKN